jgi:ATP-binding cassette subfamily D (ALD) long-chain fatty acid import protein
VIEDVQKGHFKKTLVSSADVDDNAAVLRGRGTVMEGENIEFDRVPIVSPNGDVLIKELSFIIRPGDHLLIGESSCMVFHSAADISDSRAKWLRQVVPLSYTRLFVAMLVSVYLLMLYLANLYSGGTVHKPSSTQIFLLPQRPYLPHGTLRDQLIYPDSLSIMHARNITDDDLLAHLSLLSISSLVTKSPSGFDFTSNSWSDILSIGMQQRIAMARMFYHRPKYAILDECTSSVTAEVEEVMYREAKRLGVTLMTVSHRRSLWRWHEKILQFDGQGGYWFGDLDAQSRLKLEDEKEELDLQLRAVPDIERRIAELTV